MGLFDAYDPCREAVLNPTDVYGPIEDFPQTVLVSFRQSPVDIALEKYPHRRLSALSSGNAVPVYEIQVPAAEGEAMGLGLYRSTMGAPLTAALLEEVIAMGGRRFIFFGSCGTLDREIPAGHFIVPTAAYRDEGTSYHYLLPDAGDYIEVDTALDTADYLRSMGLPLVTAKVWTTDGLYRETRRNMERRRQEGCRVVDMECSAIMAVARFRGVWAHIFFYAEDNLDDVSWDPRIMGKVPASASELHLEAAIHIARLTARLRG